MNKLDAIYARQSVDKADSISIESQIEFCKYETRGEPCLIYYDKGYSGKDTHRPQFLDMLAAVREGRIKRVICYKLDRCSRSILDFTKLMDELQRNRVEFVSCTEKFDTSTPMGRAMLSICIVFAQLERETIQQRIQDAYFARSRRGFYMGGRIPFGFRLETYCLEGKKTARYVPVSHEAEILRKIYRCYAMPQSSLADVVKMLHAEKIANPRRTDGVWVRSQLGRWLKNPIYVKADSGVCRYYEDRGVIIENPQSDFLGRNGCYLYSSRGKLQLVLAPHDGIVSAEIWLQCAEKDNRRSVRHGTSNMWLAGTVKCAKCGYAMVMRQRQGESGQVYRYLYCSRSVGADKTCEGVGGILGAALEQILLNEMDGCIKKAEPLCRQFGIRLPDLRSAWDQLGLLRRKSTLQLLIGRISVDRDRIEILWKL